MSWKKALGGLDKFAEALDLMSSLNRGCKENNDTAYNNRALIPNLLHTTLCRQQITKERKRRGINTRLTWEHQLLQMTFTHQKEKPKKEMFMRRIQAGIRVLPSSLPPFSSQGRHSPQSNFSCCSCTQLSFLDHPRTRHLRCFTTFTFAPFHHIFLLLFVYVS